MKRRDTVLALVTFGAAPFASLAQQQTKVWRIGILAPSSSKNPLFFDVFLQGMRELGYVEGRNIQYEWRFAEGKYDRLPTLAAELVKLKVDLILAPTTASALAAQQSTKTIPIVMLSIGDPIGPGFVASLARPGGNITGLSLLWNESSQKHLELLLAMVPKLSRVGLLLNPANPGYKWYLHLVEAASKKNGMHVFPVMARTTEEIGRAFSTVVKEHVEALLVMSEPFLFDNRAQIVELAAKARLPTVYAQPEFVEAGGLMSYGSSVEEHYRRAPHYVDAILKGASPAELPVEQSTTFQLVINLKTAKALGLKVPQWVLLRADQVIE